MCIRTHFAINSKVYTTWEWQWEFRIENANSNGNGNGFKWMHSYGFSLALVCTCSSSQSLVIAKICILFGRLINWMIIILSHILSPPYTYILSLSHSFSLHGGLRNHYMIATTFTTHFVGIYAVHSVRQVPKPLGWYIEHTHTLSSHLH